LDLAAEKNPSTTSDTVKRLLFSNFAFIFFDLSITPVIITRHTHSASLQTTFDFATKPLLSVLTTSLVANCIHEDNFQWNIEGKFYQQFLHDFPLVPHPKSREKVQRNHQKTAQRNLINISGVKKKLWSVMIQQFNAVRKCWLHGFGY
jgi:hypothetical protein